MCAIKLSELLLHLTQLPKIETTESITKDRDKNQSKTPV